MAERESSIVKWGKSQGLSEADAFKKLGEYHDQFQRLYVSGPFITWSDDDLAAHKSFSSVFRNSPELLRAYNDYRETVAGEDSVVDALESARNSYGVADIGRAIGDAFGGSFDEDSFKEILGGFGIEKVGDKVILPYQSKQELEGINESIKDRGLSDDEVEEEDRKEVLDKNEALKEEERAARAQNIFNVDEDPRTAALRQRVDSTKFDPFMFGTQGQRSQINDLLDSSSGKIPMPNRSDARSMAKFNNAFDSREFVRDAALRKQRDLENLGDNRRGVVDRHFNAMSQWEAANKGKHPMADKGLENWSDQDKINFVRNYNLGNLKLEDPATAPAQASAPAQTPATAPAQAAPAPVSTVHDVFKNKGTFETAPGSSIKNLWSPVSYPAAKEKGVPPPQVKRSRSMGRIEETAPKPEPTVTESKKVNYMVQPTLNEPAVLPPQDPFTASDAQKGYDEIKTMRDLDEAKKVNQLKSQLDLIDMQKSKAQNLADTKDFYSRKAPRFEKIGGVIRQTYDPYSLDTMKSRQTVMEGIQNSKSGDPMADWQKEEEEKRRRKNQNIFG